MMAYNSGPAVRGLAVVTDDLQTEMRAFDQLGPLTRAILNNEMPINWSARLTLDMMRARRMNDAMMARQLRGAIGEIIQRLYATDAMAR